MTCTKKNASRATMTRAFLLAGAAGCAFAAPATAQSVPATTPPPAAAPASGPMTEQGAPPSGPTTTAPAASGAPANPDDGSSPTAGDEPSEIVVTGTRIRGIAPVGAAVIQLDQNAIKATGIASTTDVLKSVPQISNIGSDESRTGSGAGGQTFNIAQSSSINLRGLGTQATLTLINGRRAAPGGVFANLFDASAIPTIAVSNLEVLADGSSALYGSDAIAGVVNIGLRTNFTGLEANARLTTGEDYDAQRYAAIGGYNWGSGHIMLAGEYFRSSSVAAADRPDLFIGAGQPIIQIPNAAPIPIGYSNTTPLPNFTLNGVPYAVNRDGTATAGVKNVFSRWTGANFLPRTKRYSVVGSAEQELTDTISLYAQGHYSRREFDQLASRGGGGGAGANTTALRVGANNPYLVQFLARNRLTGVPGPLLFGFLESVGPASQEGNNTNWLAVGGAKIKLPHDFLGDISISHGENREKRLSSPGINNNALTTALNSSNPATAFNPFGPTPDSVLAGIRGYNDQTTGYDLTILSAKADGSLFALPGGEVKIAVGGEYAWNKELTYNFATLNSVPDSSGAPIVQDTGRRMQVASGFAEVVVPLFGPDNAVGGLRRLDLSAAVRYDRYHVKDCRVTVTSVTSQGVPCSSTDPAFDTWNPKFGVTWKPLDDLTLRGSYGTSFRYNLLVSDPNGAPLYTANGTYSDAVLGTTIAVLRGGGFPDVKPERAKTYTFGAEYKPEFARGLELSATYFHVKYTNIIANPDAIFGGNNPAQSALYAPYLVRRPSKIRPGADDTAFNALVAQVTGSSFYGSGAVAANTPAGIYSVNVYVEQRNQNIGTLKTDGIDFTASYRFDLGKTQWLLGIVGSKYFHYKRSVAPGVPLVEVDGTIDFPTEYRLRGQLGFTAGPVRTNFFGNYTPSYRNTYDITAATPAGARVDDQFTVDATLAIDFGQLDDNIAFKGLTLGIDVINLFDTKPAFARVGAPIVQNFDSSTASALGQTISLRIAKAF